MICTRAAWYPQAPTVVPQASICMNLPNKLTVSRLGLAGLFVVCFSVPVPFRYTAGLVIFLVAAGTDYLDGFLARKHALITDFGKLMDPLADKILTASALIYLAGTTIADLRAFPEWAVIATGLRSLAASKGIVISAERIGKHKTAWQMITIIYFLTLLALSEMTATSWLKILWNAGQDFLVPFTVILTVYSGVAYLVKNRNLIETD